MQRRFTDIFIRKPVFATCISLGILLVGLVCYFNMDVRLYPRVDSPLITITSTYHGANSEIMEGFVTTPVEEAISTVDGIDYVTSESTLGQSVINIYMKLGFDANLAMTDISNKVSSVRSQLPQDMDDPVIAKAASDPTPLLLLNVVGKGVDPKDVTDYLVRVVQPQIQTVTGVSEADILGEREYAMRIWLDPYLMTARDISAVDVWNAIEHYNVIGPAGSIKSNFQEIDLYSNTDLQNAKDFNDILLRNNNGQLVKIKDVGQAELGIDNMDFSSFSNDKEAIFLHVAEKSDANPLTVEEDVMKLVNTKVIPHLPKGLSIDTFFNSTKFIWASIDEVGVTVAEACVFVFIVIFLMLGSVRAIIIPMVTIPLSIAGACIIMLALDFSINVLTLLAFVLAIGLVVDDAIVVLENIHRHLAVGLTPKQAALIGAREIAFAVIAMTITLAAVYTPIGFLGGLTGKLFTEFAFTLAGAVLISGFVALTLSPMMCSKIYRQGENLHAGFPGFVDRNFARVRDGYKKLLQIAIKLRYIIVLIALLIYASCYLLSLGLQKELAPEEDGGSIFAIGYAPAAANLDYTEQQTKYMQMLYKKMVPEREGWVVVNGYPSGVSSAFSVVVLKDWDKRKRTAMQIRDSLLFPMWSIPGIEAFPYIPSMLPGSTGYTPVQFVLSSTGTYDQLQEDTNKFVQAIKQWGGVTNVRSDLKIDAPQVNVEIDRDKAADLQIPISDIATTLNTLLSKARVNYFNMNGRSYEVLPRLYRNYRDLPDALNNINIRTGSGTLIPLSNVVSLKEEVIPESRNHFQQLRSASITANMMPGVSLGTALQHLTKLAQQVLPKEIQIDYGGQSRQYIQSAGAMAQLFIFALLFIYLVLAAQFESFRDPFIVMLTVPLAIAGAFMGLYLCHGTLNIYTEIGLVTLVGLITKNGILIVEFANQQQERGVAFHHAIIEAAAQRLRPILMTTFAMILGAIPLAMATGAGAVSRKEMGFVIVFGMSFGTLLTLFVVPVAYYLIGEHKKAINLEEEEHKLLEAVEAAEAVSKASKEEPHSK